MRSTRLLFLYNPASGRARFRRPDEARVWLSAQGFAPEACTVMSCLEPEEVQVRALAEGGHDAVCLLGGDGTLSHFLSAHARAGADTPVCFLPCGTTNDFARTLYGPRVPRPADADFSLQRQLAEALPRICDIGTFNGRPYAYIAAFGAFTRTSWSTDARLKRLLGHGAYVLSGLLHAREELSASVPAVFEGDFGRLEGEWIYASMTGSTSMGGLKTPLLAGTDLSDGLFEVILVRRPTGAADLLATLRKLLTGRGEAPGVHCFRARRLTARLAESRDWTVDGEHAGLLDRAEVGIRPGAVRYLV